MGGCGRREDEDDEDDEDDEKAGIRGVVSDEDDGKD